MSPSNFWLEPPETRPKHDHRDDYLTVTEHKMASAAKGRSEPLTDRDWLPSQLGELLFGQNDDSGEQLRTFLLVDPTLRRDVRGVFDLDDELDVPARCLFQGEAAETLKGSAPYIVDLSLSASNGKVSRFHSDFFRHHWGKGTGIIVRSQASMDDLWRHFRKFTRLQVAEDRRWVFFRFWDPRIALSYFTGICDWPDRAARFFHIRHGGQRIQMFIESGDGSLCTQIIPNDRLPLERDNTSRPPMLLEDRDFRLFHAHMRKQFIIDLAAQGAALWPYRRRVHQNDASWWQEIEGIVDDAYRWGLSQDYDIRDYVSISLGKGKPFWNRPDVLAVLARPHLNTPELRMLALRNQLETGAIQ